MLVCLALDAFVGEGLPSTLCLDFIVLTLGVFNTVGIDTFVFMREIQIACAFVICICWESVGAIFMTLAFVDASTINVVDWVHSGIIEMATLALGTRVISVASASCTKVDNIFLVAPLIRSAVIIFVANLNDDYITR
jgi:hypothetical protein